MIYCTLLNPSIDLIYTIESFASGTTLRDVPLGTYPAGKGVNVASVVRILGEEVCVIGVMPERDANRFTACLESRGIEHHFFPTPGDARANVTVIERKEGAVTHLNSAAPALPSRIEDEFVAFVDKRIRAGDLWCFTGSLPAGLDDGMYAKLVRMCKEKRADTLLDTRGKPLRLGLRAKPSAIKPNSSELEELFGEQVRGVHHIALKGKKLLDRGVAHVFISLGSDGMIALHDNDCLLCVPPDVATLDTVGCGDALMAGILVAWKRQFSFSETCRLAIACGSSKAMHEGPQMVTRDEVWQLMEDVKITAI